MDAPFSQLPLVGRKGKEHYLDAARSREGMVYGLCALDEREHGGVFGLHNKDKRMVVIFDEASGIHDTNLSNTSSTLTRREHRNHLDSVWQSYPAVWRIP